MNKQEALVLSLLAVSSLQGCPEAERSGAEKSETVDSTRSAAASTTSGKKTVCKNGKLCTQLDDGKEFCITPFVPCKEK